MRFLRLLKLIDVAAPGDECRLNVALANRIGRRAVLGLGAITLSGCVTERSSMAPLIQSSDMDSEPASPAMYRGLSDGGFQIPEVDLDQLDARFWRRDVDYKSDEKIGTLIVDTPAKYLYHVISPNRATRYGIGVGREGFEWSGRAKVAYSRRWPRWVPPDSMIARQPELGKYSAAAGGMAPGLANPLGARALYIFENGRDTLYRLHGTNEPDSIGKAVSSGCIRLLNQDIIHLFDHAKPGSQIVVIPDARMVNEPDGKHVSTTAQSNGPRRLAGDSTAVFPRGHSRME
ncbi:L,D-transpeptidase [Bradyrhizobium sp. 180]|nr:L,D-transpeptidase [Bradyrhizobium sp. 180]MCK1719517.1 L,D-transpeptidase [Bradyrhizobium sp. 141]